METAEQISLFENFIEEYYQHELLEAIRKGKKSVVVNFSDVIKFDPELATLFLDQPEETIKAAELSIERKENTTGFKVRFKSLPKTQTMFISSIRSKHLNKFLCFEGIVRIKSKVSPRITSARFECPNCNNILNVLQLDTYFKEPAHCSCGRKGKFDMISKELVDGFSVTLEEPTEFTTGGAELKRLNVFFRGDLTDEEIEKKIYQGARVIVNGYLVELFRKAGKEGKSTELDFYLECNYAEPLEKGFGDIKITEEDKQKFKEIVKKDPINLLAESAFYQLEGYTKIKEAIILQMAGGVRKIVGGQTIRGDIHVLLIGDTGCQPAGSKVLMADGSWKNIEGIKVGDEILSPQEDKAYKFAKVIKTNTVFSSENYDIIQTKTNKKLYSCSYNHQIPLFSRRRYRSGKWIFKNIPAKECNKSLKQEHLCFKIPYFKNMKYKIEPLTINVVKNNYIGEVYGFELDSPSGWYITDNFMVTHNSGKSQFLKIGKNCVPKGRYSSGKGASGAGLTAAVVKNDLLGGWACEAGLLPLCNDGMAFIDELDKMDPIDRTALHEALEEQTVSINKANIQATLLSRTTVLAAANPKFGRFDPYGEIYKQIDLPPTLVNRFDMIFTFKDKADIDKDDKIASAILAPATEEGVIKEINLLDEETIRKYIAYSKTFSPKLSKSAHKRLKDFYIKIRNMNIRGGVKEEDKDDIPISPRQLQSLIRFTEASSKIRHSNLASVEDADKAIDFIHYFLTQFATDPETGKLDIDRIMLGETAKKKQGEVVWDILEAISKENSDGLVPINQAEQKLMNEGLSKLKIEEYIAKLKKRGDIFEPRNGFLKFI